MSRLPGDGHNDHRGHARHDRCPASGPVRAARPRAVASPGRHGHRREGAEAHHDRHPRARPGAADGRRADDPVQEAATVIAVGALARTAEARAVTAGRNRIRPVRVAPTPVTPLSVATTAMGGGLTVHLDSTARSPGTGRSTDDIGPDGSEERARRDAGRVLARVGRWAGRLSRHLPESELSLLNGDPRTVVGVGPTS